MTPIPELIHEYKQQCAICYAIDYADSRSVARNNRAVTRMYQIVDRIHDGYGQTGMIEFAKILGETQDRADLWAAVHMLEKMTVDEQTEAKALHIIHAEARESLGMEQWLNLYREKKKQGK